MRNFDLLDYARRNRLRTRNLHDGYPVPPAIHKKRDGTEQSYSGQNRFDVVVGYNGYIYQDKSNLGAVAFFKTAKGVNLSRAAFEKIGATIEQEGDSEIGVSFDASEIESALKIIKVSRVANRNPAGNPANLLRKE